MVMPGDLAGASEVDGRAGLWAECAILAGGLACGLVMVRSSVSRGGGNVESGA